MATFFVDGTGLVTTASTVADSIHVQSAALPGSTILGLDGNDTINLIEGSIANASAVGIKIEAGAGADSITISGLQDFSAGNASVYGGAGGDTIAVTGNGYFGLIKTQDDADVVIFSGTTNTVVEAKFGKGADSITLEGGTLTDIGLGKGHDHLSAASFTLGTAATINLGEGRDTIVIESMGTTLSAATLLGDAAGGTNYGADSIFIDVLQSASTVKGQGGDDTITLSGETYTKLFVNGGGQNDVITVSGYGAGATIGGGSGADTLDILGQQNAGIANSAYFNGGSGNDSIALTFNNDHFGLSANQIDGGAGADSISLISVAGNDFSGAVLPTLQYSAFSESNLTTMDAITFSVSNTTGTVSVGFDYGVDLSAAVITERSALNLDVASTFSGNIAAGIVTLSGASQVSSVTAVAATVDTLTLPDGANEVAIFTTTGGQDYLFVQGGVAGTADDSIVSLGDLSGGAFALSTTNNTAYFTFSGG